MFFLNLDFTFVLVPQWSVVCGSIAVALMVDWYFGEPRISFHPVVWMGRYLGCVGQRIATPTKQIAPSSDASSPAFQFVASALTWSVGCTVLAALAVLITSVLTLTASLWLQALLLGFLLKPLLAWRMLHDEVSAVERALLVSTQAGRDRVARLVSRDVSNLDDSAVREAAIATLAENLNDSVVAPLFWFVVAGLPGAAIYRFANTADAMWGYRGVRAGYDWTWAGKWAARADDVLSWLPARLTALLLGVPSFFRGFGQLAANAKLTPSPNSGWPMAALAISLRIHLTKVDVYALNPQGRAPQARDTAQALRRCSQVVALLALTNVAVLALGFLIQGERS